MMKTKNTIVVLTTSNENLYDAKFFEPIGPNDEMLIDYTIYDAIEAGFEKVILVVSGTIKNFLKRNIQEKFKGQIKMHWVSANPISRFSRIRRISFDQFSPNSYALWKARKYINGPFLVVNGHFYYGKKLYHIALDFLKKQKADFAVINYSLGKTLSRFGGVDRCICIVNKQANLLKQLLEVRNIRKRDSHIYHENYDLIRLSETTLATTGIYCLNTQFFDAYHQLEKSSRKGKPFSDTKITIPFLINYTIQNNICRVKMIRANSNWFSINYKPERVLAISKIRELINKNEYPKILYRQRTKDQLKTA